MTKRLGFWKLGLGWALGIGVWSFVTMSGHSHWAGIKHKKAINDKKRAQEFAKAGRLLMVAARQGGSDPTTNATLRTAMEKARALNMPKDNIERAIQKGAGELEGQKLEEAIIEAYGPAGVAILVKIITDNKNRTVAELRHIFSRYGGKLAEGGGVAWMFERTAALALALPDGRTKEDFELEVIDAGAQETTWEENLLYAYCSAEASDAFREELDTRAIVPQEIEYILKAKTDVPVNEGIRGQLERLFEELDNHDDVQAVYSNAAM